MKPEKLKRLKELREEIKNNENFALLEGFEKLQRDIFEAIKSGKLSIPKDQASYMVDFYYGLQKARVAFGNKIFADEKKIHDLLVWFHDQLLYFEAGLKEVLDAWTETIEICRWAKSIKGIGPILSAGLYSHVEIEKTKSVASLWKFAGQDPTCVWMKHKKRPWNAALKVIVYKIGESFKKCSGKRESFFGKLYRQRKELEVKRNESGEHKETAKLELETKDYDKETNAYKAYKKGKLPDGRVDRRACRFAAKLFLAVWWDKLYELTYGKKPRKPYVVEYLGHKDYYKPEDIS